MVGADLHIRPNALSLHNPNRLRHIITQTIHRILAQYFMLIQRVPKRVMSAQPQPPAPSNSRKR